MAYCGNPSGSRTQNNLLQRHITVLETGALPIELRGYIVRQDGFEPPMFTVEGTWSTATRIRHYATDA